MSTYTYSVGMDLSLTRTGLAALAPDGRIEVATVTSKGKRNDPWYQRVMRLEAMCEGIYSFVPKGSYIVIEGPSYGSAGASSSLWDRAGLWHRVVADLIIAGFPVAVAPPTTVKKWATGSGNADKAAVASAITRLRPDIEILDSDTSDAVALAHMGGHRHGWAQYSKARTLCLDGVQWAEEILGERAA